MVRALGIGDRVKFVGFVPREEVDPYYAAADLFVFTSVTETQGLVVQEAMAFGLPAIVATGGGAGANVTSGANGFIVKNEAEDVARHIKLLLEDERLYSQFSESARESVRGYTTADMCDKVLDLYRQVIGERAIEREQGVLAGL